LNGIFIVAPDEKNQNFRGEVKIVNRENPEDFYYIDISLSTPKEVQQTIFSLFYRLAEKFPIFPLLFSYFL
jgi:hypothetical protein